MDDKSQDATVEMLRSLSSPGDAGMRAYALPQNSGGGVAAGFGVEKAVGEILIIVDHDDELEDFALATVASEWSAIASRPEIGGMFFRRSIPATGVVIGEALHEGLEFTMSWQANVRPSITDGVIAFRRTAAVKWFNAKSLESICLFGVPLNQMTKHHKLRAGSSRPILRYHRDNLQSQTNAVKISRKTVYTYAKYIDDWDRYYLLRPVYWAKHMVTLARFSLAVHNSSWHYMRYLDSAIIRVVSAFFVPLAILRQRLASPLSVVAIGVFEFRVLASLQDLRQSDDDLRSSESVSQASPSSLNARS